MHIFIDLICERNFATLYRTSFKTCVLFDEKKFMTLSNKILYSGHRLHSLQNFIVIFFEISKKIKLFFRNVVKEVKRERNAS